MRQGEQKNRRVRVVGTSAAFEQMYLGRAPTDLETPRPTIRRPRRLGVEYGDILQRKHAISRNS